jgi:aminoglycoside phosphotransferase family enzyme/predicted kinase
MQDYIDDLIEFLSIPGSYPDQVEKIEIVQTHASVVAITDKYVYKVKKPINFEFMDFSTLDKREFYCREETRLNQRLTNDIYLDILTIYHCEGIFSFDPVGPTVDFAIKMRLLPPEGFLSFLLKNGKVKPKHFNLIAQKLCQFYNSLPPQDLDPKYGSKESIAYITGENQLMRRKFINKSLYPIQDKIISTYQSNFLKKNEGLIEKRKGEGWVRDTHGDLRIEHFHFGNVELNIYDCIEFEERLRANDLVNDIAFLSMELDYVGFSQEARKMYEEVVMCTGDTLQDDLWLFYKTHRACVRGMVHAVTAFEHEVGDMEKEQNRKSSMEHFGLATRYALLGAKPVVILVYGGVATGKSTIAKKLSELLFIPHIQSDATRKELASIPIDEYPDETIRKWLYSDEMTKKTYTAMIEKGRSFLKRYNAVILDSRWSRVEQMKLVEDLLEDAQVKRIRTISDIGFRRERLKEREKEKSISDARLEVFDQLMKDEDASIVDDQNTLLVDTGRPLELCIEEALAFISE